jgi:hypothetical protein
MTNIAEIILRLAAGTPITASSGSIAIFTASQ